MATSIILIGPGGAGKTTIAKLLGQKLGWAVIEVDDVRVKYRAEIGYDDAYAKKLRDQRDFIAQEKYWKPFDIHAVERVLQDYPEDLVISFGAGNSVYEDKTYLARARKALENIKHVIQLLPSPDVDESVRIITERLRPLLDPDALEPVMKLNRAFIKHPSNEALATITFYNADQSPEETIEAILKHIQSST